MRAPRSAISIFIALASMFGGDVIAGTTYRVSAEISEHGKTVASPTVVVKAGAPASVVISGDKGYSFTVQIQPAEQGTIDVTARAETATGKIDSNLSGKLDAPMTVATGDIGLKITVASVGG